MQRSLLFALLATLLLVGGARAETGPDYSMVLLTENFPPYNMAINGKNFAQEDNIDGIAVDIVREMFKRAGIKYSLTLRFPWDRIYKLALEKPGYGVFVTARLAEREDKFKWVGPIGPDDWVLLAKGDSPITLGSLDEAKKYRIGAYKGDAIAEFLGKNGFEADLALRDQENAQKLVKGQIDLWASGDPAGRYLAKQEGVTGLKTVLRFNSDQLYLALNRETPDEVVQKLQAALDGMRKEGFVEDILNSYL
ncbi:ABC transporter substrate-binding protein [Pseudomonas aeruginosa]|uniref:substrate-binding periplasmic protein n=1 Tax=Pseudomonas aeruginosa TaxID=287 RepID=UPI000F86631C|nr:ABC transporter substrate-binding protein [Pseudomonas aeruginosa]MCQ9819425.1 ABC transporter substrate-binding protein [Pseudomonas aeruginosa]RUA53829.1 ABC transporter substrate-binding protein [Pseudomonas aeruginosa]HBN8533993.1 ABC transporter substrate-binding protein [Pseudomonas aeruginosa]HCF3420870.1 ABC transporter substrate-binding protein [Pseudomonas aeruginosa]HCF3503468.1 ABC transporter substrate-binding protein [Pseudomonas aeruginosa]